MPRYVIEAWWNVIYQAKQTIVAADPAAALAIGKALIEEDDGFLVDNEPCDNSDGDTNLTVWTEDMTAEVAEDPSASLQLERAGPDLLAALRTAVQISPNDMLDTLWGKQARAAIAKAGG